MWRVFKLEEKKETTKERRRKERRGLNIQTGEKKWDGKKWDGKKWEEKRREEKGRGCGDFFNLKYLYTMDSLEKQNCLWSTITDAVEKFFFFVVVDYVKIWTGFVSSHTLQPYLFFTCHYFAFAASPFSFFSIWFVGQVMHGLYNTRCMWVSVCTKSNQRLCLQMCNNWGVRVWIYLPVINFLFFNFYFFFPLSISLPFWDKLGEEIQDQFFLYDILNIQKKKSQPLFHFLFSSSFLFT